MTSFISRFIADHSSIQNALPILVDTALKGALLVVVAACAAYLLRKHSAASRHGVWTAAVIGHLAIPALVLVLPAWRMPVLPAAPWMRTGSIRVAPATRSTTTDAATRGNLVPPSTVGDASGATRSPTENPDHQIGASENTTPTASAEVKQTPAGAGIAPIVAMVWFIGALLVLLRLAIGTWRVGQLAREGARVEDGVWLSLTQRLANRLGVTRPLTLLRGDRLAVPVTWGIVYPAVLLPQDSDSWTEERRRFVLVHEMAHVKRFDALTQLLAQVAVAVFWFDPLLWIAAHQMRVEREHACDDYVLRDGTAPSLYAGELLEMVRSIGTPHHDRAAPAFAALAMARRSEFEGRMLAILDPGLDRQTLERRGTLMTVAIVALLTLPLAALRPFQQPNTPEPTLPASFRVSISEAPQATAPSATSGSASSAQSAPTTPLGATTATTWQSAQSATFSAQPTVHSAWSCDTYLRFTRGTSTHVNVNDSGANQVIQYVMTTSDRCAEATVVGPAKFSPDETRLAQLSPGGFARFRERTATADRAVSAVPVGDGSLSYSAMLNGRTVPFDASMQSWLAGFLPQVLREAGINVPERVARIRAQGGVLAVLNEIGQIRSTGAKRAHYEALLKSGPLSSADAEKITIQVGRDLIGSSGDLSAIVQQLPRNSLRSVPARQAVADALSRIKSSGDKANTLSILAPNADPELLLLLAKAAEDLPSSGDKANFLMTTAAEYLSPGNESLRNAYLRTVSTLQSSGDMANVLLTAMPYGHANPALTFQVVAASKGLKSSGDAANVLLGLTSQRLLQANNPRATIVAIERTLTMESSGDRANVLIAIANANLLSTPEVKDAFSKATLALPSESDRANVLASASRYR